MVFTSGPFLPTTIRSAMRLRSLRAPVTVLAALLLPAATAVAAESPMPTSQAKAYGMDWVPYIDPANLPPVHQRKVVCLVDSGVGVDEDLPADRPEGPVIVRTSLWGDSGLDGSGWENQHGTRMASFAGAVPGNDWGTVGAWPAVRIYSVRAMAHDERVFRPSAYRQGVQACRLAATDSQPDPIVAINLSLGCRCTIGAAEQGYLDEQVARAQNRDISILAAAGNGGGALGSPADTAGLVPVAAGDTAGGGLCSYASYGPGVLVGPGCGVDVSYGGQPAWTDGGGSSAATMFASTLLALLRTLRPDAGRAAAEAWLRDGTRTFSGRPVVDGEGAFRAAGLGAMVDRARARMTARSAPQRTAPAPRADTPSWLPAPTGAVAPPVMLAPRRLPRPRVALRWSRPTLTVRMLATSQGAERLRLRVTGRAGAASRIRILTISRRRTWHARFAHRPARVRVAALPKAGSRSRSPSRELVLSYRRSAYR